MVNRWPGFIRLTGFHGSGSELIECEPNKREEDNGKIIDK